MSQSKTALWLTNDDAVLVAEALGQWAEEYATQAQHAQAMSLVAKAVAIAFPGEISGA